MTGKAVKARADWVLRIISIAPCECAQTVVQRRRFGTDGPLCKRRRRDCEKDAASVVWIESNPLL